MTNTFLCFAIVAASMAQSAFGQSAATPANYFPLEAGNRWEYQLDVSADRQIWQVTRQETIKQNTWFLLDIETVRVDADGKRRRTGSTQRWVRIDGSRLMTRRTSDQEDVWVDFAATAGQPYPSPGACHTKATNSPHPDNLTVLFDRACSDAGLLEETFVPHVGLQSFSMDSFVGSRTWRLVAGHVGGKDLAF